MSKDQLQQKIEHLAVRISELEASDEKHKQAEEALKASEKKYRSFVHNFHGIAFRGRMDFSVDFFDGAVEEITGYTQDDFQAGKLRWDQLVHPDDLAYFHEQVKIAQSNPGPTSEIKHRIVRKDGQARWIRQISQVNYDESGQPTHVDGVIYDITDRRKAEEDKESFEEQLRQSQKMEAVGRLAGGVAHDFNNMLAAILGYSDMIMEQLDPREPIYADLTQIIKAAERSSSLTGQLLAFARKQTVVPKVIDLDTILNGMNGMLQRVIGEDIDLLWKPGKDLRPVRMDPSQVDQILVNLCVNARDAITDVGKVTIQTQNAVLEEDYCAGRAGFTPGAYVSLAVIDTGCGMSPETMKEIFEPFFTTKKTGKGTGLGLSTVYGIVKQNNGFIDVSSDPGNGTTFTIYLPQYLAEISRAKELDTGQLVEPGHETILLVEDESTILKLTTRILENQGYKVVAARNPGEALSLTREYTGEIHLLITDVVMPEMNGRDLARKVLISYPKIKCLFMSGYTADVIAHHGVLDEGVNFLQKPFRKDDLTAKVQKVLDRK